MCEIVGGVVRDRDLVTKLIFFLACLLVVCENLNFSLYGTLCEIWKLFAPCVRKKHWTILIKISDHELVPPLPDMVCLIPFRLILISSTPISSNLVSSTMRIMEVNID